MPTGLMSADASQLPPRNIRVAEAFLSYDSDLVRIVNRSLAGATHVVASRRGLYAVNEKEWTLIAHGFFFGVTIRDGDIYAFEACDQPRSSLRRGRIVRISIENQSVTDAAVLVKGLDNGCHQIDFIGPQLHVVDTYNQQIVRVSESWDTKEILTPLPTCENGRWSRDDPQYVHVNSLLRVDGFNLLLLHNVSEHTGLNSQLAAYDPEWRLLWKTELQGRSCHGLALTADGSLLICDSMHGDVISADGTFRVHVSPLITRGLAIGEDSVVVGASVFTNREDRMHATGTVTFMERNYSVRSVLSVPGAPTEIRRLDGQDQGISNWLVGTPSVGNFEKLWNSNAANKNNG